MGGAANFAGGGIAKNSWCEFRTSARVRTKLTRVARSDETC